MSQSQSSPVSPAVSPEDLERSLDSPLRLRLVADLLDRAGASFGLDDAVVSSSRHVQDVLACLRPMVRWGVLEESADGRGFRLRADLSPELRQALARGVEARSDLLNRERRVRFDVLAGMIGVNPKMQLIFEMIRQVSRIDVPVLITGETGTGKELVARAIHDLSHRRSAFFGAVNCATLTETLFESQVFGHARGAFTGAVRDHAGLVEQCDRGTLFLDEVGDLQLANQVKLLRVLQQGTFSRLGDGAVRSSNFRLVAATNRDLGTMVAAGLFREDLFYRLNVFPMRLPSLRERLDDLPYLVAEMLAHDTRLGASGTRPTISAEALAVLAGHSWPGNIRELENVVVRAAIMAQGDAIRPEHLPPLGTPLSAQPSPSEQPGEERVRTLEEIERDHIAFALRAKRGNIRSAAAALGVTRATIYKKMKRYGLETAMPELRQKPR
ncbi:MAG: sigma-54-dependent Fis family transcriptional regulator [Deltaproteobacteria bacterium]|nr:sigma-54-dependent Fis family transcriptional regulator [Deltaproteobacteria bacterium]